MKTTKKERDNNAFEKAPTVQRIIFDHFSKKKKKKTGHFSNSNIKMKKKKQKKKEKTIAKELTELKR